MVTSFGTYHPEAMLWAGVLLVQSSPYLAAFTLSLSNAFPVVQPAAAHPAPVTLERLAQGGR